jgi:hypothetical protein
LAAARGRLRFHEETQAQDQGYDLNRLCDHADGVNGLRRRMQHRQAHGAAGRVGGYERGTEERDQERKLAVVGAQVDAETEGHQQRSSREEGESEERRFTDVLGRLRDMDPATEGAGDEETLG